jgi:hypothetical protein
MTSIIAQYHQIISLAISVNHLETNLHKGNTLQLFIQSQSLVNVLHFY